MLNKCILKKRRGNIYYSTYLNLGGYKDGYNKSGCDSWGFNREGIHKKTGISFDQNGYDKGGYDKEGYDRYGYDKEGYDKEGYDKKGYDREGFDRKGFNIDGIHRDTNTKFNLEDLNRRGISREEIEKFQQARRKRWLALKANVEKLAKGKISIEEYMMKSKTSIDDLIAFAKRQHFSSDIIKGLYRQKRDYKIYKKALKASEYLCTTILLKNGEKVELTKEDVVACIKYLRENHIIICNKTIRDTICQYKNGELDITQRMEQVIEKSTKTQLEILEEEQRELEQTLENVEQLENEVTQVENKDKSIKIGD